jgi:hypothetical protein
MIAGPRRAPSSAAAASELGLALRLPSCRRRDKASSTHLTIGNRANRTILQRTHCSVRYLEAGFETPAVVGNLPQSSATTGRAFGHTKSRRVLSVLGGVERRAGIVVLSPRSAFRQGHSTATTPRWARPAQLVDSVWNSASLTRDCALPVRRSRATGHHLRAVRQTWALSRNSARRTSTATTNSRISFDALCWRGKVLLFTDHGRRTARPAYESMVERGRSLVAQQPRNLR